MSTKFIFANNAGSQLAAPVLAAATSITLATGTGARFPSPTAGQYFEVTIVDAGTGLIREICYCTARAGDVLTVTRAQEGTTARDWAIFDPVANLITAGQAAVFAQNPSDLVGGVSAVQVYAGNPNGHVAGNAGVAGTSAPSMVWDITNKIIWVCTTTGVAAAAVWVAPDATQNIAYCGLATGTANAIILTPTIPATSYAAGNAYSFIVAITNTNATVVNISGLGNVNIYKEGPSGPIPLTGGELVASNLVSMRFDGTQMQLTATELGTAALKNTGNTVADPGTGALEIASPMGSATTGNSYSILAADRGKTRKRSNSGTAMTDTLPAIITITDGWFVTVLNTDATAGDTISAPGGVSLNGTVAGSIVVGPLQSVTISYDGSAYWVTKSPVPKSNVSYIGSNTVLTTANSGNVYGATAAITITFPRTTTAGNGWYVSVAASTGNNCTMTPNAADSINSGSVGAVYTLPGGTSALFVSDGAGNIEVFYQTAVPGLSPSPSALTTNQTIAVGQYVVDTSAGVISLTLPASPTADSVIVLEDAQDTWFINNVILISGGGGNTINGSASNFNLDVSGVRAMLVYKSGNWSFA